MELSLTSIVDEPKPQSFEGSSSLPETSPSAAVDCIEVFSNTLCFLGELEDFFAPAAEMIEALMRANWWMDLTLLTQATLRSLRLPIRT